MWPSDLSEKTTLATCGLLSTRRKLGDVLALGNSHFQRAWAWEVKVKGVWDPSAGHTTIATIHFLLCHCTHVPGQPSSRERFRSTLQHGGTPYSR